MNAATNEVSAARVARGVQPEASAASTADEVARMTTAARTATPACRARALVGEDFHRGGVDQDVQPDQAVLERQRRALHTAEGGVEADVAGLGAVDEHLVRGGVIADLGLLAVPDVHVDPELAGRPGREDAVEVQRRSADAGRYGAGDALERTDHRGAGVQLASEPARPPPRVPLAGRR